MDANFEMQLLRRRLQELMAQASENTNKARRFQSLELKLIGSNSLPELINAVIDDYRSAFDLDVVTLALLDREYEIRRLLESAALPVRSKNRLIFLSSKNELQSLQALSLFPRMGRFNPRKFGWLFPDVDPRPNSIAMLPLVGHGRVLGSLNLGSLRKDRFNSSMGADFLERLAAIASLCFENSINHERLKKMGITDALTGVHNRRFFEQRFQEELHRSERSGKPLSCLFFDVDHFKAVNDKHGHRNGDLVLREVSRLLSKHMRGSDILVRYGGEEFAALLVETPQHEAYEIAERSRQAVEDTPFMLPTGDVLRITISIGVATRRSQDLLDKGDNLVHFADMALLSAKQTGRNKVVLYKNCPVRISAKQA